MNRRICFVAAAVVACVAPLALSSSLGVAAIAGVRTHVSSEPSAHGLPAGADAAVPSSRALPSSADEGGTGAQSPGQDPPLEPRIYLPFAEGPIRAKPTEEVLRLQLDEDAGATVFLDATGHGGNGRCTASACPAAGVFGELGTGVKFDGENDFIAVADAPALSTGPADGLTIELWVLPLSATCDRCPLVSKSDGARGFALDLADGEGHTRPTLTLSDGADTATVRAASQVTLNRWHHVAAVVRRDEGVARLYVDGTEVEYARQDSVADVGDLTTGADLLVGSRGQSSSLSAAVRDVGMYRRALTGAEVREHGRRPEARAEPWFPRWNSDQVHRVLVGFGLADATAEPVRAAEWRLLPPLASEAGRFGTPGACADCAAVAMTFATARDLVAVRDAIGSAARNLIVHENVIVLFTGVPDDEARARYVEALENGMLTSVMDAPSDLGPGDFEKWAEYYPTDRGQQRDPANGRSQRTFDRWENPANTWMFGQATWRFQDPDDPDAPPPGLPATYGGRPVDYYYHYHCEQEVAADPSQDCMNWMIYIELLARGADDTELGNWARGGWQSLVARTPRWESYYRPGTFASCEPTYIEQNVTDATLRDPAVKVPLLFRLPSVVGAWATQPEVCEVAFDSYLHRASDVTQADLWRTMTTLLDKSFDVATGRYVIEADNRTYLFVAEVAGDRLYRQRAREIYWTRQVTPEEPLKYGMEAFWWWKWPQPPEQHRNTDADPTWAPLQWCRLDRSRGPEGLGALVCEP